jgi:hypothetical protein
LYIHNDFFVHYFTLFTNWFWKVTRAVGIYYFEVIFPSLFRWATVVLQTYLHSQSLADLLGTSEMVSP